jgi:membrane associated rhomboid family serine protease
MNPERFPVEELREVGVRFTGSEPRANDWALVLASAGIGHRLDRTLGGWQLLVGIEDLGRANGALDAYDRENPPRVAPPPPAVEYGGSHVGAVAAMALFAFHAVARAGFGVPWLSRGAASAELLLHGQAWRSITALTLHADLAHALSNAVACALFLTLLARRLGPGVAVALTLLAGAGGNFLNALVHGSGHSSIGASTAIFGAVGLLGALQAVRGRRGSRWPSWVPLAASLGILAMLGSAKETDLLAHLFGFATGVALGTAAGYALRRPPRPAVQVGLALASLAAVAGSWALALR